MAEDWRRIVDDDEAAAAMPEPGLDNPVSVAALLLQGLADPQEYSNALHNLTTPESWPQWGDFGAAADSVAKLGSWSIGTVAEPAVGDPAVCYVKVLRDVDESYQVLREHIVNVAAVVTLVWRPDAGAWLVHAIGDYVRPEGVPH